jgi:putative transposase
MSWKKLLESVSESVNDHLRLRNAYLVAENGILRNQIDGRVPLTDSERKELAALGAKLGRKALEEIATVAQPDTILAWNRKFVDQQADTSKLQTPVGRPRVGKAIEDLVVRMARENRTWGYDRIQGALNHLGYTISDQAVGNILKRHGIPPAPQHKKTATWTEFIRIHMDVLGATDFFTRTVWNWLGLVVSFLLVLMHVARRTRPTAGTQARGHVSWMLHISPRSAKRRADMKRWIRAVLEKWLSRMLPGGTRIRPPLLSASGIAHQCEGLPQRMGQVVRIPTIRHRPIRDGPMEGRPRSGGWLQDDNRMAA